MRDETASSTWITIVLITVVAILVFLVFVYSRSMPNGSEPSAPSGIEQSSATEESAQPAY